MLGGLAIMRNNDSLISKAPADKLKEIRAKCQETGKTMTMEEIDEEIQAYRRDE